LLIAGFTLAVKYQEDFYYNNVFYAKIGGISCHELNSLESEMLRLLNFDLFVTEEIYSSYETQIKNYNFSSEVPANNQVLLTPGTSSSSPKKYNMDTFSKGCEFSKVSSQASFKTVSSQSDLLNDN